MRRWWKLPRNPFFGLYYHNVLRSDDDRAHHDHVSWSLSIVLEGGYYEHRILAGGIHVKKWYDAGSMLFRYHGGIAHRLELANETRDIPAQAYDLPSDDGIYQSMYIAPQRVTVELSAKTIFITGPVLRRWGFHHTDSWVDAYEWDEYCQARGLAGHKMSGYAAQLKKD